MCLYKKIQQRTLKQVKDSKSHFMILQILKTCVLMEIQVTVPVEGPRGRPGSASPQTYSL